MQRRIYEQGGHEYVDVVQMSKEGNTKQRELKKNQIRNIDGVVSEDEVSTVGASLVLTPWSR